MFGRAPDIGHLVGRAKAKGLTAIAARPKMGKTWLLTQVGWQLSRDGYLVGYHEAKDISAEYMLRAVADLYEFWLSDASSQEQAKSFWRRNKDKLIPGVAQAFGVIFDSLAETIGLKPVGQIVREGFEALLRADTDLRTAGLELPKLDYEKARELVRIVAEVSTKPIVLIFDAWDPSDQAEFKLFDSFLGHLADWPLCHMFLGLRPEDPA